MERFLTVTLTIDKRGVATITLNRPDNHHAIDHKMIYEIQEAVTSLNSNEFVKIIIFRSSGPIFCSGGDLSWMKSIKKKRSTLISEARSLANMFACIDRAKKPTIACVSGDVYGGGIGLIAACDFIFCIQSIKLRFSETRLGLIPATIGPFIYNRVGRGQARALLLSSRAFSAQRAYQLGLVTHLFEENEHLESGLNLETDSILKSSSAAMSATKKMWHFFNDSEANDIKEYTVQALADRWECKETRSAIKSFLERKNK